MGERLELHRLVAAAGAAQRGLVLAPEQIQDERAVAALEVVPGELSGACVRNTGVLLLLREEDRQSDHPDDIRKGVRLPRESVYGYAIKLKNDHLIRRAPSF